MNRRPPDQCEIDRNVNQWITNNTKKANYFDEMLDALNDTFNKNGKSIIIAYHDVIGFAIFDDGQHLNPNKSLCLKEALEFFFSKHNENVT